MTTAITVRRNVLGALPILLCSAAFAQATAIEQVRHPLDVPAQDMESALQAVVLAGSGRLLYRHELLVGKTSPPIKGNLTTAEAVQRLLVGTGLTYEVTPTSVVIIKTLSQTSDSSTDRLPNTRLAAVGQSDLQGGDSGPRPAESAGAGQLEEIVVTAEKRSETLTKTPLAVSALSQQQLVDAGVQSLKNLADSAPNVEVRTVSIADAIQVSIRGITNTDYNEAANPAVATYIDGVYVGRSEGMNGALYDLERVEVLRGPQGTLYGLNSTGGNLNILTASPKNAFDAAADVAFGNYGDVQTHAMVNLPVSDTFALRAAIATHRNNGYFNTDGTTTRNYGMADDYAGRLTALWTPSSSFKWRVSVDDFVSNGTPGLSVDTGPNGKPASGLPVFNEPVTNFPEPSNYIRNTMLRSRIDWNLSDSLSLDYVAGYQDVVAIPQTIVGGTQNLPPALELWWMRPSANTTQEVDLNFDTGGLHNILGASYWHQHYLMQGGYDIPSADDLFEWHARIISQAWGVFDQATYNLTGGLRLIGGVRYTNDSMAARSVHAINCPLDLYSTKPVNTFTNFVGPGCVLSPQGVNNTESEDGKWSNVSWKGGVEYDFSDRASGYLTVTTGFKAGGLNLGVGELQDTYQPEKLTNYELGLKSRFLENRASLNAALFFEDYRNLQETQVNSSGTANITLNAAKARIYGLELEGDWRVTSQDRFSGYMNYLHATYLDYHGAIDQEFGTLYPSLDGNSLPHAPRFSTRLQYSHDFSVGNGATLTPMAAVYWQTTSYLREFNLPIDRVGSYSKTSLDLTYADGSGRWKVAGYVDNLEDRDIRNGTLAILGRYWSDYDPPRTYGVRVSYQY